MEKYEEMISMVMSDTVTLDDWRVFRKYYESLPSSNTGITLRTELKPTEDEKYFEDFLKAAKHVVQKLPKKEIHQDIVLTMTYVELRNP